ncbi:glyoxalase [Longispora fulva]|uniref:Extradiol dioxygenase family protein n=1 Tax=Longispora fulva TaxID=619741 RepID=A0A8J7GDA7_9ACTN|nr:VOC family protein [Longispora fulva]MBG6135920.1 extradiol dioxygenase family protein [Longispora fulva]GIG55837.1 glyoxalase [Longispora fulva]
MTEAVRPRFHLAVPVEDLDSARAFYGGVLGLSEGRSTDISVDWDLYGHQFVTHLAAGGSAESRNVVDGRDVPVPHFGLLLTVPEFHKLADRLREVDTAFVVEPYLRFAGQPAEQWTMFFRDPSGNALEFKAFLAEDALFAR